MKNISLNPFGTGQCLSTAAYALNEHFERSQSLWNRAMSFDTSYCVQHTEVAVVSIPLEQGNVFRHNQQVKDYLDQWSQSLWNRAMSFDRGFKGLHEVFYGLNPFGTGQCLSTAVGC